MKKTQFAPYIDVSVDAVWDDWQNYPNGRPNPIYSQAAIDYGMDMLYLGFLTADVNHNAAWSAQLAMPIDWAAPMSQELVAGNVKVAVAFGGAANSDVSVVQTVDQLISTYQTVIDTLNASHLDFDFENGQYDADKTFSALSTTMEENPELTLSLTLPTMPTGLTNTGLTLVKKSINAGLQMKINGMAMDYYDPNYTDMGAAATKAATSIKNQLSEFYPAFTDQELFDLVQITPMIGLNDDKTMFNFGDVTTLSQFAKNNGLNLISMWSLTRDKPGSETSAVATSSGNPEQTKDFEYSEYFTTALKS